MAPSLLDLPNEILAEIISYPHSSVDLFAIIRTSRYFRELFQTIGPSIIRQRFGETAFSGQVGLCAAVTSFRLSWLRCDEHLRGCSDRSVCARSLYQDFVAQDVTPLSHHEVIGFQNIIELVDEAINFHLAHDVQTKTCRREHCPDCTYEYSPSTGPCLTIYSKSAQKVVVEARCHFFFHGLYYRTYFMKGKLRRDMIRLIKKAVQEYDYRHSPAISWADLRRLINKFFYKIGVRYHPSTMVHSHVPRSPIRGRRPPPLPFPLAYMALLRSP